MVEHKVCLEPAPGDGRGLEVDRRTTRGDRALGERDESAAEFRLERAAAGDEHTPGEPANRAVKRRREDRLWKVAGKRLRRGRSECDQVAREFGGRSRPEQAIRENQVPVLHVDQVPEPWGFLVAQSHVPEPEHPPRARRARFR